MNAVMEYKWVALSNTTIGTLMAGIDTNIVLIALPTIGRELPGSSLFSLLWILLGYQLVTASVLINFGRLADMFGRTRLYTMGFAFFTISSALCGLSQNATQLVAFRMAQGVGAAFIFSNSAAILTDAFPAAERGRALGTNQVAIVVGSVVGLVVGGLITSFAGWRWIFWINVPIGLFGTIWSHYKLHDLIKLQKGQKIDVAGNVTFASGLTLILLGMTLFDLTSLPDTIFYLFVGMGVSLLTAFILIERRVEEPMFDLSLFKIRVFSAGNLAILLNALARGALILVLTFYLQGPTMGLDPFTAGLYLIPMSLSLSFFGPVSGWLSDRHGSRVLCTLGLVVSSIGFLLLAELPDTIGFWALAVPLILAGSGFGLFAAPNRASVMNAIPPNTRGVGASTGTTLTNAGRTFSMGLAFAVMASTVPFTVLDGLLTGRGVPTGNVSWVGGFINSIHVIYFITTAFLIVAIIPSLMKGPQPRADKASTIVVE